MTAQPDPSRRTFLQSLGAAVPTLAFLGDDRSARPSGAHPQAAAAAEKFTPLDLSARFTASAIDFGPRDLARNLNPDSARDGLVRAPATGRQTLRGIPFLLGPDDVQAKSWVVLSTRKASWATARLEVPVAGTAGYVCLAHFCDWDPNERPAPGEEVIEQVGQRLADLCLLYADGREERLPVRRRFEVNSLSVPWGHLPFRAVSHRADVASTLDDPLPIASRFWGDLQRGVWDGSYPTRPGLSSQATLWVCAIENPHSDAALKAVRFEAAGEDALVLCGLSLFEGREHPLRYERRALYRITLPEPVTEGDRRWKVAVDLGTIARTYLLRDFDAGAWLGAPPAVIGDRPAPVSQARYLYVELAASRGATLTLHDTQSGGVHEFDLARLVPGEELEARSRAARVQVLDQEKVWVHGRVVDAATGRPVAARLALLSSRGRYIPPYGHRTEVNTGWFQDYGADVKLMDRSFAYVDGTFQVELPVGPVYVEVHRGFEYRPIRQQIDVRRDTRTLDLQLSRLAHARSDGWVSADVHVHFLSPSTAVLEGEAEGLNLINLLAAQWGEMFSNVGDLPHGPITSRDGEMIVKVATENRQHLLGHLALASGDNVPVFPMSAAGQNESYIGDPVWTSLAEWAEASRKHDGIAYAMHFPYPTAEIAADIVLGKLDAVELAPKRTENFGRLVFQDWYRYLNLGCRLPAVGGTDKMSAGVAVGQNRTYANLGKAEFTFANWAAAVRKGNTFVTSGPLLFFRADGRAPGDEVVLGKGGATFDVSVEVASTVPVHRVEVVFNGRVIASRDEPAGAGAVALRERVRIEGPGWLAARCASKLDVFKYSAHTSPIYVKVPGQDVFSAPAAQYVLTLIEGAEIWTKELATRAGASPNAAVLKTLADARDVLHRRLHEHGITH